MSATSLAHELRTPLTAIRGFAELLATLDGPDDAVARHELVERLIRNTARVEALVDEVVGDDER
jgi:signal transduction histidine kinase